MPHLHEQEEESFYILERTIRFQVGEETLTAEAGAFVKAPQGVSHAFKNAGDTPARVLLLVAPAGLENFFEEVGHSLEEPPSPPSSEKVKKIAAKFGVTILSGE
jgi:quercetin dioxygenase-like cupin family protein